MERSAKLVVAAEILRRHIWASLPIKTRLGEFFVRLASHGTDAFGLAMFQTFAQQGVQGFEGVKNPKHLPPQLQHEGRNFGAKVYATLLKKFHNVNTVEDIMGNFMLRFWDKGAKHLEPGSSLAQAQGYVMQGVINEGLNFIRGVKNKHEVSDIVTDGDGDQTTIYDTHAAPEREESEEDILREVMPRIRGKLKSIHPDAETYVRLALIEGYKDTEIVGDVANGKPSLLSHPYNSQGGALTAKSWNTLYKKKIYDVLRTVMGGNVRPLD